MPDLNTIPTQNTVNMNAINSTIDSIGFINGSDAPARNVLTRAESFGPKTGWRDGHLSSDHGFCPPDPSASSVALASSSGE